MAYIELFSRWAINIERKGHINGLHRGMINLLVPAQKRRQPIPTKPSEDLKNTNQFTRVSITPQDVWNS
jgi:hypothetical protein